MKKLLLTLALLALAGGARAEDNAAKLALAREAIAAMQADKMLDSMTDAMKRMALQVAHLPDSATPEQRQKFEAYMSKVMDLSMSEAKAMITKMDSVYADIYSEAELKAMIAFFQSAEGKSMMAKQPQVMARIMPLAQEMQQSLMPKMQKLVQEFQADLAAAPAAPAAPATPTAPAEPATPAKTTP